MIQRITQKAFDLIVKFETGGRAEYNKHPEWPQGQSGVTIGFGYDLGYEQNFVADWQPYLDADAIGRLSRTLGYTGSRAHQALSGVRDIEVPWDAAEAVFNDRTLPQEIHTTLAAFPGSADKLPADAFGALVSLVFNRGGLIDDTDRRREMKEIKETILDMAPNEVPALQKIAELFRSQKRLWPDHHNDSDLVARREAEAVLIENA